MAFATLGEKDHKSAAKATKKCLDSMKRFFLKASLEKDIFTKESLLEFLELEYESQPMNAQDVIEKSESKEQKIEEKPNENP